MSASPKSPGDVAVKRRTAPVRVLLVEDDRIDRMAIERHVLRQGLPFEVAAAQSGVEAVRMLRERPFDLVLLDYMLGDMTGLELLPELRGVPAIFISGMGNEEIAVRALHQGAYDYIVKDPDRAYLQVLPIIMRNVLERRSAEDSLRESQRKMDTLMRNLPGMAYRALPTGDLPLEFVSAGCLDLTGYDVAQLTAQSFGLRQLILPDDRAACEEGLRAAMLNGGTYELSYRIQPHAGKPKWVWDRGVVVPGVSGGDPALEGFLSDVTEQRGAEEQLRNAKNVAEQATLLKDKFVSLVAHDLRVPLTTCSLTFQMLRDELSKNLEPRHQELFSTLSSSSESMLRMIDDLLLVSRLQSGALRPKPRFLGAGSIRSSLIALDPLANEKRVSLTMELPDDFRVFADPNLLGEVLQNLVTNSIKFTPAGGRVAVRAGMSDGPHIEVKDSGVGIDPGRLRELAGPEGYASMPGTAGEKGTGLGLRICHDILAAHGGRLELESEPGRGTTARVHLPAVAPRVALYGIATEARGTVERVLSGFAAQIVTPQSPEDLANALRTQSPHLLVADTGASGEHLKSLAAARELEGIAPVPLLLLASVPVKQTGPQAPEDVVEYPLDESVLRKHLRRFLG